MKKKTGGRKPSKGARRSFTLALEGATYEGSVALLADSTVIAERTISPEDGGIPRMGRGERLMPAVAECLKEGDVKRSEIARIVCGAGPGSFTSLRVAGSVAIAVSRSVLRTDRHALTVELSDVRTIAAPLADRMGRPSCGSISMKRTGVP